MLRHKNIVELYHAFVEGKQLIMIMEFAGGGELLEYLTKNGKLSEVQSRKIFLQICNAIHYCHMKGVVHRDLKLENVLFKDEDEEMIKIIDFGIAGVCTTGQEDTVDAGTINYMPPECFGDEPVNSSPSLDVWAIGLMFYAMLYGTLPFVADSESKIR
jgi:serine/threonine protein kinase